MTDVELVGSVGMAILVIAGECDRLARDETKVRTEVTPQLRTCGACGCLCRDDESCPNCVLQLGGPVEAVRFP